eukprot:COSAG02_NODE_459_length_21908_cov_5.444725_10_plen_864_part_00
MTNPSESPRASTHDTDRCLARAEETEAVRRRWLRASAEGGPTPMQSLTDATPAETEAVRQLLHQTMPDATLVRVQRNQHDLLYRQYVARRDAVDAEAGYVHERWLWNGNDSIAENISKGFDLRYASQEFNKYGVGVYFGADARLSAFFERSTRDSTGEKKIILARVALGQMAERSAVQGQAQPNRTASGGTQMINPELTKPDWKLPPPGAQSATSRQRIEAIVYENHQAFPHYLVTYRATPRPSPYGGALNPPLRKIDEAPQNSDIRVRNGQVQSFLSVAQERAAAAAAAEKERREREAAKAEAAAAAREAERLARELQETQRRAEVAQQRVDVVAQAAGYGGDSTPPTATATPAPAPAPALGVPRPVSRNWSDFTHLIKVVVYWCLLPIAIIIFGAGSIARLMAMTDLHGTWLIVVSMLLCVMLFVMLFCFCYGFSTRSAVVKLDSTTFTWWVLTGVFAMTLCGILAPIGEKISYMENASPAVAGVDPTGGTREVLVQDLTREISFVPGSYIDLSLSTALVESHCDAQPVRGCSQAAIASVCMAPVVSTCGAASSVSASFCTPETGTSPPPYEGSVPIVGGSIERFCSERSEALPTCRAPTTAQLAATRGERPDYGYPSLLSPDSCDRDSRCGLCRGDCDDDSDCARGLVCFQRDSRYNTPPGCGFHDDSDAMDDIDDDDDFCVDRNFVHPDQVTGVNSNFWIYLHVDSSMWPAVPYTVFADRPDELEEYETGEILCERIWETVTREWMDHKGVDGEIFLPANTREISGHITPFFDNAREKILEAYHKGPAVKDGEVRGEVAPIFLKWQPELGFEEAQLWRTGMRWALKMGLWWLAIPMLRVLLVLVLGYRRNSYRNSRWLP